MVNLFLLGRLCLILKKFADFEKQLLHILDDNVKMKQMGKIALSVVQENQGATGRNIDAFEQLLRKKDISLKGK